jgi:hypothetical protein
MGAVYDEVARARLPFSGEFWGALPPVLKERDFAKILKIHN